MPLARALFCPRYCHALVLGILSPNKYYCHALVLGRAKTHTLTDTQKKLRHWSFIYLNYSFHIQKLQFKYLVLGEDLVEEGESLYFHSTFYFLSHSFLLPLPLNSVTTAVV
jgi:hypothetical protein